MDRAQRAERERVATQAVRDRLKIDQSLRLLQEPDLHQQRRSPLVTAIIAQGQSSRHLAHPANCPLSYLSAKYRRWATVVPPSLPKRFELLTPRFGVLCS